MAGELQLAEAVHDVFAIVGASTPLRTLEVTDFERDEYGRLFRMIKRQGVREWDAYTARAALERVLVAAVDAGEGLLADELAQLLGVRWRMTDDELAAEVAALAARAGITDDEEGSDE